jgi:hypothetical protein
VEGVNTILAPALATEPGLDVHVVTTDDDISSAERAAYGPLTVHRLPWRARRMLSGAIGPAGRSVRDYVEALAPDVVHAHDTFGIMLADLDLPRVLTIHGFIHADTRVSGERFARLRSRMWERVETSAWGRYPRIISISPYVRERLTGKVRGTIHDIDNPVAADFFEVVPRTAPPTVFCAASISPRKNILGLCALQDRVRCRPTRSACGIASVRTGSTTVSPCSRRSAGATSATSSRARAWPRSSRSRRTHR